MQSAEDTIIERKVKPVGNLLNDNDSGVDQLGYLVYAQALAKLLHNCRPPISIGVFGPWGIGKTFLLKHVQGLLRKYELQERYDISSHAERKCKNFTEEDSPVNDTSSKYAAADVTPTNETRSVNLRRAFINHCVSAVVFLLFATVIGLLLALVLLAPAFSKVGNTRTDGNITDFVHELPRARSRITVAGVGNVTEPKDNTTGVMLGNGGTPTINDGPDIIISQNLRLYLILLLVALTGMVFGVFCCCVSNTNSKSWSRFCSNYKLILYAAFTRLPTVSVANDDEWYEASNPYMVTHFDDEWAKLCYDPGAEENMRGVKITSKEIRRLPKKYIFVNYHAWQYAGSDTLWAGIVTRLSDAIENEFGTVCARLFRMLQVERPSKSGPIKIGRHDSEDPRSIYVRFKFPERYEASKREKVLFLLKEFGVVTVCSNYKNSSWWYVRYSNDKESDYAEAALKLDDFEVRKKRPILPSKKTSKNRSSVSASGVDSGEVKSPLVHVHGNKDQHRSTVNKIPMSDLPSKLETDRIKNSVPRNARRQSQFTSTDDDTSCCCCLKRQCRGFNHFRRHPKTVCCGCPFLYCCFFFVIAAILFPVTIMILADHLELGIMKSTRVIPIEVQIFSWFPAMLGVLVVAIRFCWAMCHSQTDRIRKAVAGSPGSVKNALGFMSDVKNEVMIMSELINCVRFTHGVDYKIVITIDDLDRCPYNKVKSVLEAVSILLSDRSSPFLCLIAVDSRVAVKCIEQDMGDVLLQAHLTGHEYLKKIINLPFCLPEVANNAKRKYFGGIMDSADATKLVRVTELKKGAKDKTIPLNRSSEEILKTYGNAEQSNTNLDEIVDVARHATVAMSHSGGIDIDGPKQPAPAVAQEALPGDRLESHDYSEFLFRCREILDGVGPVGKFIHKHLCGNPRNMKRIFNVLSLTTHLMECIAERRQRLDYVGWHRRGFTQRTRSSHSRRASIVNSDLSPSKRASAFGRNAKDAEDLVKWIVAADQWPYRISYILQVVEDSDHRREAGIDGPVIADFCTLSELYEKYVEPEIALYQGTTTMLSLDEDPAILRSFLQGSPSLTRGRVSLLFHITVNLDQSLRNGISRQRAIPKPGANL